MQYQTIKYFLRLPSLNKDRLLYKSYLQDKTMYTNGENCFLTYVIDILNKLGMSNIWIHQLQHEDEITSTIKETTLQAIFTRLTDIFSQSCFDHIQNTTSGKLNFLKSMKDNFHMEAYLKINNFENRRAISKLRTSNHNLAIETGRWTKTERENRLCTNCENSKIEDEYHFLFECPRYSEERNTLFQFIKTHANIDLYYRTNRSEKLKLLFTSKILSSLNALGRFIRLSFEERNLNHNEQHCK